MRLQYNFHAHGKSQKQNTTTCKIFVPSGPNVPGASSRYLPVVLTDCCASLFEIILTSGLKEPAATHQRPGVMLVMLTLIIHVLHYSGPSGDISTTEIFSKQEIGFIFTQQSHHRRPQAARPDIIHIGTRTTMFSRSWHV